jgi:ferric-dicitrate binding protein FerR (iron transport regulator)
LEGRIAVSANGHRVEVVELEVSEVHQGLPPSVRPVEDLSSLLDWPGGILIFKNTPLSRAADEVSRFFGRTIEFTEDVPVDRRVSASFGTETFTEVITTLCVIADVRCLVSDSASVIAARDTAQ